MAAALQSPRHAPAAPPQLGSIYRLADHLDATLAMGEDLLRQKLDVALLVPEDAHSAISARNQAISQFARAVRALELGITSRLLQARLRATEVRDVDARFSPVLSLLSAGTAVLADAAAGRDGGLGDISQAALMGGSEVLQFLKSRALVDESTPSLSAVSVLGVTEDYLLAAQIHLGTLLDMIAQILDTLDLAFDLYAEPRKEA
jgi:hypothetical protein